MIMPSLTALFANTTRQLCSNFGPFLCSINPNKLTNFAIFLRIEKDQKGEGEVGERRGGSGGRLTASVQGPFVNSGFKTFVHR
jgi:hypothetical protein